MRPQSIIFTVANQFESGEMVTISQILQVYMIWNLEKSCTIFMPPALGVIMRRKMDGLWRQSSSKLNSTEKIFRDLFTVRFGSFNSPVSKQSYGHIQWELCQMLKFWNSPLTSDDHWMYSRVLKNCPISTSCLLLCFSLGLLLKDTSEEFTLTDNKWVLNPHSLVDRQFL